MSWPTIRDARDEDCRAIAAIYNEAIAEGRSTFETRPHSAADVGGKDVRYGAQGG